MATQKLNPSLLASINKNLSADLGLLQKQGEKFILEHGAKTNIVEHMSDHYSDDDEVIKSAFDIDDDLSLIKTASSFTELQKHLENLQGKLQDIQRSCKNTSQKISGRSALGRLQLKDLNKLMKDMTTTTTNLLNLITIQLQQIDNITKPDSKMVQTAVQRDRLSLSAQVAVYQHLGSPTLASSASSSSSTTAPSSSSSQPVAIDPDSDSNPAPDLIMIS